jgi:hypothetical protein
VNVQFKVAYVWYYYIAVQRMSHTFRYYPGGIPKSSGRPVLLVYVYCTIYRVCRTICQRMLGGLPA